MPYKTKEFWECARCGDEYKPEASGFSRICPECESAGLQRMTWEQYHDALVRLHGRISSNLKLVFWDDTTIGNKDTQCSWGLCTSEPEQWPDPNVHIWPHSFVTTGRIAPRHRQEGQYCPFDRRAWEENPEDTYAFGCFHRCMFFNAEGRTRPNREQAEALFLTLIERSRNMDKAKGKRR